MKFSDKVYRIVKNIPCGEVLNYKEVATLAGSPKASRAVGNILNKNPDIKTIPCHRVIRSDDSIGGYKYGSKRKEALLRKEGVIVRNGRIDR